MKNPLANLFKKKSPVEEANPKPKSLKKDNIFSKFIKERLGKNSVKGEEIVGVDLGTNEIRLAQISTNKANQWILEKFYSHKFEGLPANSTVLENPDKIAECHWWIHESFGTREYLEAAELIAFERFNLTLVSRVTPSTRALEISNDEVFKK